MAQSISSPSPVGSISPQVLLLIQRLLGLTPFGSVQTGPRPLPTRNVSQPFAPPAAAPAPALPAPVIPPRARSGSVPPGVSPVASVLAPGVGPGVNISTGTNIPGVYRPPTDPWLSYQAPQTPFSNAAGNWAMNALAANGDASALDYANLAADIRRQGNDFGPPGARYTPNGGTMFGPGPVGPYALTQGGFQGNPNTYVAPGYNLLGNPTY